MEDWIGSAPNLGVRVGHMSYLAIRAIVRKAVVDGTSKTDLAVLQNKGMRAEAFQELLIV